MVTSTEVKTVLWPGKSGNKYRYWIYQLPPEFAAVPGNYIFAKRNSAGQWTPVYIGQTDDLSERFDNHHKINCIRRNGATHIHAHKTTSKSARLAEETDLLGLWSPPCNG